MFDGPLRAPRTFRSHPAAGFRSAANDRRVAVPAKRVAFGAAPGAQVQFQLRRAPGDCNLLACWNSPQRTLHQQMPAFLEFQIAKVYLHCAITVLTNVSIVPKRSTAAASCSYPLVRPGSHCLSPSMSRRGRTSALA